MKDIILFIVLFQLVIIFLFLYIDIFPYIRKKINKSRIKFLIGNEDYIVEEKIVNAAIRMCYSKRVEMILNDSTDFITGVSILLTKILKPKADITWYYNFPKAFLIIGLFDYVESNEKDISLVRKIFLPYYNAWENNTMRIDRIMRIPFALIALRLYEITCDAKYKIMVQDAYMRLKQWRNSNNILFYFSNTDHQYKQLHYVDGLGMYIPFLVKYYEVFNDNEALLMAINNFDYYTKYGTDSNGLPFHNINNNNPLGPNNWGRGIAWYILGLLPLLKHKEEYNKIANNLWKQLNQFKLRDSIWSQFPGASLKIDSSATIPYLLLGTYLHKTNKQAVMKTIKYLTLSDGRIYYNSGDTRDINTYSKSFSTSEFTQGVLLSLISKYKC